MKAETPEAEILRVGSTWEARSGGKTLRSPPDPISIIELESLSLITLRQGDRTANEELEIKERFTMRDGGAFVCHARGSTRVQLRFGRKSGSAALEINRPPVALIRQCQPPGFPNPEVALPSGAARFLLRGDQLAAFDPPLDKRIYIPID